MFTRFSVFVASCLLAFALTPAQGQQPYINELDPDTVNTPSTDAFEFVELKGTPGSSANGYVLVYYNGGTTGSQGYSYRATDLDGKTFDANGYLMLGTTGLDPDPELTHNGNTLQNGADALALYTANATDFPNGTLVHSTGLVDYVVYTNTGYSPDPTPADWSGFGPSVQILNEDLLGESALDSISRMPDGGRGRLPAPRQEQQTQARVKGRLQSRPVSRSIL